MKEGIGIGHILFFVMFFTLTDNFGQANVIVSGVHNGKSPTEGKRNVLKGGTTHFESFAVDLLTLKAGEKKSRMAAPKDAEEVIIVKAGKVQVSIESGNMTLGSGSVAFIIPGDRYTFENQGTEPATYYRLTFKSKSRSQKNIIESFLIEGNDVPMKSSERGGRRDFFNKSTFTCQKFEMHVTTLNKGLASHAPHTHPEEEIILMIKGNGTMIIGTDEVEVPSESLVFLASGVSHGFKNTGPEQCEYFAIQWK